jgi:hypothetical protein
MISARWRRERSPTATAPRIHELGWTLAVDLSTGLGPPVRVAQCAQRELLAKALEGVVLHEGSLLRVDLELVYVVFTAFLIVGEVGLLIDGDV